jgi:hypothetical protein
MKTWKTIQNMGEDIAEIDRLTQLEKNSGIKELNAAQCSHIASYVKKMYISHGKDIMIRDFIKGAKDYKGIPLKLRDRLPKSHQSTGLTPEEKKRARQAIKKLFRWYWFPFSKIQRNMRILTK